MTTPHLYQEAISFIESYIVQDLRLVSSHPQDHNSIIDLYSNFSSINRMNYLMQSGWIELNEDLEQLNDDVSSHVLNVFMDIAIALQIHLNCLVKDGYQTLIDECKKSIGNVINANAFPEETSSRIDINVLDDPIRMVFYMGHEAFRTLLVDASIAIIPVRGEDDESAEHTN